MQPVQYLNWTPYPQRTPVSRVSAANALPFCGRCNLARTREFLECESNRKGLPPSSRLGPSGRTTLAHEAASLQLAGAALDGVGEHIAIGPAQIAGFTVKRGVGLGIEHFD